MDNKLKLSSKILIINNIIKKNFILVFCQLICISCNNILPSHTNSYSSKNHQPIYLLADRETLLMRGYTTSFTDGYLDGCQTGQYYAGDNYSNYTKNEEHAKINKDYLTGWEQGNSFCYEHMHNLIKNSGSNDPNIYRSKEAIEKEKQRMWMELKK